MEEHTIKILERYDKMKTMTYSWEKKYDRWDTEPDDNLLFDELENENEKQDDEISLDDIELDDELELDESEFDK